MKVNETVKNYESERRMYANYVLRNIKKVCKEVGPRDAGSPEELKAQEWMAEDLKTSCDEVKIEPFDVHPRAFMGWIDIMVFCATVAAALFFGAHFLPDFAKPMLIAGVVLIAVSLVSVVAEFLFYKKFLDAFTKKKTSHNLIGIRKASGEVKRRIIFAGHADSAMEWRFTYWGGPKLVVPSIVMGLLGVLYVGVSSVIALVFALTDKFEGNNVIWILSIVAVCFIPVFLFFTLFYNPKRIVEGANDDLTGCLISMAMTRYLSDHDIRFENTEVWSVCTGSEEAGLRGSKALAKAYAKQFKDEKDVETVFVAVDTVRDFDFMAIYNKDMTGLVKNDDQASNLVKEGGKLAGYELPYKTVSLGATDAAAMTQAGIKSASFAAMDPAPARYYHTRLDTHENLDLKAIEAGVDICLNTMFLFDEKGLNV